MKRFCVIIPDRGDRPEFTEHCLYQLSRQTVQPDEIYHINAPPQNDEKDIVPRIRAGIYQAKKDGFGFAFIIENDDYYPDNYFESMLFDRLLFVGYRSTYYYTLRHLTYRFMDHHGRSSLFCTGFDLSALDDFTWPDDNVVELDKKIWYFANGKRWVLKSATPVMPIGIKHGVGLCGGMYHVTDFGRRNYNRDPEMLWLRRRVRPESFDFYYELSKKIRNAQTTD